MTQSHTYSDWNELVRRIATSALETEALPVAAILPPSPWELAKLSVLLNPDLARTDPMEALRKAMAHYVAAMLYWHELSVNANAADALFSLTADLTAALGEHWKEEYYRREDAAKKRFYPGDRPDEVKAFFRVKQGRSVRDLIISFLGGEQPEPSFLPKVPRDDPEQAFERFKRTDADGTVCYLLPTSLLERVARWRRERNSQKGRKAAQKSDHRRRTSPEAPVKRKVGSKVASRTR